MTDDATPREPQHPENDQAGGESGTAADWEAGPVDDPPPGSWSDTSTIEWAPAPEGEATDPTAGAPTGDGESAPSTTEWSFTAGAAPAGAAEAQAGEDEAAEVEASAEDEAQAGEAEAQAAEADAPAVEDDAPAPADEASEALEVDPTRFQSSPRSPAPAGEPGSAAEALPADPSEAIDDPQPAPIASTHARIELYLLRHADAGDPMTWAGPDEARPLSDKGRKQSKRLAKLLESGGFEPDAVVSSPKLRALDTAKIVAKPTKSKVRTDDRLAYGVGLGTVDSILGDLPHARRVLLVGHDPDFSELVALLCNGQGVPMRKGALVRIDVTRPLTPGSGELRWLVPPDLIRADKGGAHHAS